MKSILNDPFLSLSFFILFMTIVILVIFIYLNKIALKKVREEKNKQLKIDKTKIEAQLREKLVKEFDRDQSLKINDLKADFQQKKTQASFIIYKIKNILTTMDRDKIVKETLNIVTNHFPAAAALVLLKTKSINNRLILGGKKGENIPEFKEVEISDLPMVQLSMAKRTIISKNDQSFAVSTKNDLGLNLEIVVPLISIIDGQFSSQGVIIITDLIEEPGRDDLGLLNMLSTLVGGVLNNAIDFESSVKLSEQQLREKKKLTSLFSKYVSPSIVENLMASDQMINLGGIEADIAIFFIDIRNFTTMSENMAPTKIVSLLNEYFHEMNEIIFKYEGTLDKYMGDAIMALFGAPVKKEDDCLRAIKCSLDMMKKLSEMNREWKKDGKQELSVGIGINYGTVVVGNIGSEHRYEYTAIGDNVNVASRLCSMAKPGQILISDNVFMEVFESVDINQLEPIKVKGRAEPVKIYEVTKCI